MAIISNIDHWKSCTRYFGFFAITSKNNHIKYFLSVPNLVPWLIFIAWIVIDQLCWITLHFNFQLDREGIKGREDSERRGGGGDYSREAIILNISVKERGGDYSREAINQRTAIIRGNTVTRDTYLSWTHLCSLVNLTPSSSRFPISMAWYIGKWDDRGDEFDLLGSVGAKQLIQPTSSFLILLAVNTLQ